MKAIALLLGLSCTLICSTAFGQFEGFIEFNYTKATLNEVTTYKYYVKGNHVRIEELDENKAITGIMLVDLEHNTVTALSPERELYMNVPNNKTLPETNVALTKGKKKQEVQGYKCAEWTVKSSANDRIITYWVANGEFEFFTRLLKTLNRKDNLSMFFLELDEAAGAFTMVGEERDLAGQLINKMEVVRLQEATIGDDLFVIPTSYTEFQR